VLGRCAGSSTLGEYRTYDSALGPCGSNVAPLSDGSLPGESLNGRLTCVADGGADDD